MLATKGYVLPPKRVGKSRKILLNPNSQINFPLIFPTRLLLLCSMAVFTVKSKMYVAMENERKIINPCFFTKFF